MMKRRDFVKKSVAGMAAGLAIANKNAYSLIGQAPVGQSRPSGSIENDRLFPSNLSELEWQEFRATGFSKPVSGVIYRTNSAPCCGVGLGGVSTGCLDIQADGTIGFNCLFDAFPRKPQLLKPFLGLVVGEKVWVLTSELIRGGGVMETDHEPRHAPGPWMVTIPELKGVVGAKEISYWGHYPVADIEYETDAPVAVGLRAWAPFIPGDLVTSNTPGAVFEVHLRNTTPSPQRGTLAFSFPGPTQQEAQVPANVPPRTIQIGDMEGRRPYVEGGVEARHERIQKPVNGVSVDSETRVGYCLGVLGEEGKVRTGGALGAGRLEARAGEGFFPNVPQRVDDWAKIGSTLPETQAHDFGASVAVDFNLAPKEVKIVRYVLAWYAPMWHGEGEKRYTQIYTTRYENALEVAELLARDHANLLQRVLRWQEAIYGDEQLSIWLRDTLINVLETIPEDSYWAVPNYPVDWAKPEGLFGLNECPRGSPQIECIPCSWYGNIPIVYFFPELALSSLRGYVHYMREDGAAPFRWGPGSDMANVTWEWQKSLNGVCFVDMVDRLWRRTGDEAILREFYPAVKKSTTCTMTLRPGPMGIVSMPKGNVGREWWEAHDWYGIVPHIGAMHLSNLKIAERMAEQMGDETYAGQCREWYRQGLDLMEKHTWTGEYYMHYNEPETGRKSDTIMANQIDGDWANAFHGLPEIFPSDHMKKILATVKRTCLNDKCGAVSFAYADGTPQLRSYGIFPPEVMILGMMYLYAGERETGLETLRRLMYGMVCRHRHPFDLPNMLYCDTGERWFGTDYYQDMMLWAVPAALEGRDLRSPCEGGGLVDRVMKAGKKA